MNAENFETILDTIIKDNQSFQQENNEINNGNFNYVDNNYQGDSPEESPGELQGDQNITDPTKINNLVMNLTNGWNDKNERMLISVGENAASYKWMHEKSVSFYGTINKILSIIIILFSTGLSAQTIVPNDEQTDPTSDIFRRVFTYIITLISVVQNFLKLEKISEEHRTASSNFSKLYYEIQQQMCMYRKDRKPATFYINDILKRYDTLIVSSPTINRYTLKNFKTTFEKSNIALPDIADKIQPIEVITEPVASSVTPQEAITPKNIQSKITQTSQTKIQPTIFPLQVEQRNVSNLQQILQIRGDITDEEAYEMKDLKKKHLKERSKYEFDRFRNNTLEND